MQKLNTPEFDKVNRSQCGRGTEFKQDNFEYTVNNCYIPTSDNCFMKCIKYFIKKDYSEEFLIFIRTEQRRSNVMTSTKIQPFCRKNNINIDYYDGFRVCPSNITERNIPLKMHKNHLCFFWKSNVISFRKAMEEFKNNFKVVDNVISAKRVKRFFKYEYEPEKVQSQLINIIVYDLETFDINRAVPYGNCI